MITTILITAKCTDACHIVGLDEARKPVGENNGGSVPDWMPGEHFNEYVELRVDVRTGRILNWKPPTQKELKKTLDTVPAR